MKAEFENKKLDWCKYELKTLVQRLRDGHYEQTAEIVFDHVAHTGVETDLNQSLKSKPSLDEFMQSE